MRFQNGDFKSTLSIKFFRSIFIKEWFLLLAISAVSSAVLSGRQFLFSALYHDQAKLFDVFRNNLHALNYFGEFMWRLPFADDGGVNVYILGMLGHTTFSPISILLSLVAYFMGVIGIHIQNYYPIYILYIGFIVPLMFSSSVFLLVRVLVRDHLARVFAAILIPFSPPIINNLTDIGLENAGYGVFFIAALLNYLQKPAMGRFRLLALATLTLALSVNHLSLYLNAILLPCVVIYLLVTTRLPTLRAAFTAVPWTHWAALSVASLICVAPILIALTYSADIVRNNIGARLYPYLELKPGDAAQFLLSSVPGLASLWINGVYRFIPVMAVTGEMLPLSHIYLGAFVLAAAFLGTICLIARGRIGLVIMLVGATVIIPVVGHSLIFTLLLIWETPLRAVSHYSDTLYRWGGSTLILVLSVIGFARMMRRRTMIKLGTVLFLVMAAIAVGVLLFVGVPTSMYALLAAHTAVGVLLLLTLLGAGTAKPAHRRRAGYLLVLLVGVDVSTSSFWYVREYIWPRLISFSEVSIDSIGIQDSRASYSVNLVRSKSAEFSQAKPICAAPPAFAWNLAVAAEQTRILTAWTLDRPAGQENPPVGMKFDWISDWRISDAGLGHKKRDYDLAVVSQSANPNRLAVLTHVIRPSDGGLFFGQVSPVQRPVDGVLLVIRSNMFYWHKVKRGAIGDMFGATELPANGRGDDLRLGVELNNGNAAVYVNCQQKPISQLPLPLNTPISVGLYVYDTAGSSFKALRVIEGDMAALRISEALPLLPQPNGPVAAEFSGKLVGLRQQDRVRPIAAQITKLQSTSYNTSSIRLDLAEPGVVRLKGYNHPFWRSMLNGEPVVSARDIYGDMLIAAPAGSSLLELRFSPPWLGGAILFAVATYLIGWAYCLLAGLRRKRNEPTVLEVR